MANHFSLPRTLLGLTLKVIWPKNFFSPGKLGPSATLPGANEASPQDDPTRFSVSEGKGCVVIQTVFIFIQPAKMNTDVTSLESDGGKVLFDE